MQNTHPQSSISHPLVLAYSGGLDTTFCIPFLKEKGFEIHAIAINTGGFSPTEIQDMEARAYQLGAFYFECIDISEAYYQKCIRYLVYGNILRGDTYPLSVSSERAFQAMAILDYVQKVGATHVAHGSTGAGNDQIRFDLVFKSLAPEVKIITPIRDNQYSRQDEVDFLKSRGFEWSQEKKEYSINQGIWGTSVGGKETLTSHQPLPTHAYPNSNTKMSLEKLVLEFEKGELVSVNGVQGDPIQLIQTVEAITAPLELDETSMLGIPLLESKDEWGFRRQQH